MIEQQQEEMLERYLQRLAGGETLSDRTIPDLEALRAFDAVARTGSMAGAALALRHSEALIRQHLQALEASLGVPLVQRSSPAIELTAAGERLARGVRAALAEISNTLDALKTQRFSL
jgi:LysR family transcriptional regulator, glycine cleavage system transcriptional activator